MLTSDAPVAAAFSRAIQNGDLDAVCDLLIAQPGLATERFGSSEMSGTALHIATDWAGHFPRVAEMIQLLVAAGADVHGRFAGPHAETALHWAASSDDVAAIDSLLDCGADINASGAVLGGGGPIADAVGFGQWKAAARLLERGAKTDLWQSAGLGLVDRIEQRLGTGPAASAEEITSAFWSACHGDQLAAASILRDCGADINWVGYDGLTPLGAAVRSNASDSLLAWLRASGGI